MSASRWVGCVVLYATLSAAPTAADDAAEKQEGILKALDAALAEDQARQIVDPYMEGLKVLYPQVIEKVVLKQWWGLARDIVSKSHAQQVDLSFAVRKAVRTLKDEADELLRTLNPKYGQAQQVSPAFQWAQNDTCIFLTIKYTVRWNAPGALEVSDSSVNMSGNAFSFAGFGKHSNNKYHYVLSLDTFDDIAESLSHWSTASVGKMSVTLRKRWARKWPRLLANKKAKIGNMHVWMEMQEKQDSSLKGLVTASQSPVTCGMIDKLYCVPSDVCKKPENCSSCPGKPTPVAEAHVCAGMPTEKASLSFKDADMDQHEVGGEVKIKKAKHDFDVGAYAVYWGKDEHTKLELPGGAPALVGEAVPTGSDVEVRIPQNTPVPDAATHLLVFSRNQHGEYATPGSTIVKDAFLPKVKPAGLKFVDEDGEKGEVSGTVTILRAEDQSQVGDYALHWGRSATRKISSGSSIREVSKEDSKDPTHYISANTKVPDGASHILCFAKSEHGENPSPASLKIVDNTKPCLDQGDADCPAGVQVTPDSDPAPLKVQATVTIQPARREAEVSFYVLYWGRRGCGAEGGQSGAKNGLIQELSVGLPLTVPIGGSGTDMPEGTTHILVFSKNKVGESEKCVSTNFEDNRGANAEL